MAKKSKPRQLKDAPKKTTEASTEEVTAPVEASVEETETTAENVEVTAEEPPVVAEEKPADEPEQTSEIAEPAPEPGVIETALEPAPTQAEGHDSASNNVFLPAILGGLIAAGVGFAVAYYMIPRADPNLNQTVATATADIEALRSEIEAAAAPVDLSPVTADITALRDQITGEIGDLSERIVSFEDRLTTLEKQPSGDGTLQDAALEAYQRELDDLRAQVEEQAGAAFAQLESTRAEAAAIEQAALDAAQAAQIRAALAQIQVGLTDGVPMDAALTDLEDALGEPVPAPLAAVAEGAPTLAKLQADFPNAARAALSVARSGGESGEDTTAFGAFLREQLNVRSVAPRDGDDADAVLSRAQAAVSEGQLEVALTELETLPDVAKAPLAEWVAVAQTRVAAVEAAEQISLSLNVN